MLISEQETEFRQKCKIIAIQTATNNKPTPNYEKDGLTGQRIFVTPAYDLLKEAEKIYQWLIKEDVTS